MQAEARQHTRVRIDLRFGSRDSLLWFEGGKMLEPTIGLEPMTCRLRIDPVLRMLLCDKDYTRAFWAVFEHSGDPLYSICTAR
jgi:hypothetical protein